MTWKNLGDWFWEDDFFCVIPLSMLIYARIRERDTLSTERSCSSVRKSHIKTHSLTFCGVIKGLGSITIMSGLIGSIP